MHARFPSTYPRAFQEKERQGSITHPWRDAYAYGCAASPPQVSWGVSEVCAWLETCRPKLGAKTEVYQQIMVSEDIDGEILGDMGHEELSQ